MTNAQNRFLAFIAYLVASAGFYSVAMEDLANLSTGVAMFAGLVVHFLAVGIGTSLFPFTVEARDGKEKDLP